MLRSATIALIGAVAIASPLYDYVNKNDGCFSYYDTGLSIKGGDNSSNGWTGRLLNVTSQCWLTPADFTSVIGHVWTHNLLVVTPDRGVEYPDAAALWITGGGNGGAPNQLPSTDDEDVLVCASLSTTVGTVCSVLYQIPNADVVFTADPLQKARGEDALVAFTWAQYMLHDRARPEWIR